MRKFIFSVFSSGAHYYTSPCVTIFDSILLFGYVVLVIHVYLTPSFFISALENQRV